MEKRGFEARSVAMWMVWESGAKSLREIGQDFGGLDYAAVTQRIRRTREGTPLKDRDKLVREMLNVLQGEKEAEAGQVARCAQPFVRL